ncbi:MAG TPA: phosphoribosylformylglycinamidine synthase subunit PurQ [Rhodospirillales bacterium]|jgi:phosphoribosylformylglycinamidine synthase|nr:phosphoribosylformylglycinamidine synthase subunit PurQ [Rhodospirillales bacterium]HIL76507.1 phosphoribosylformylglycinamidine synthase subunit PurQ [Rhodospirillales bacterium]
MKAAVIIFPGSNRERDMVMALKSSLGKPPIEVWHGDIELPKVDLIVLPGGFSYGDYLRSGAMAAHSPIISEVKQQAKRGVHVLGVCNGFQILTETGLLPGALMRNANLKFICKDVHLKLERDDTIFAEGYSINDVIRVPVAHHDGNYFADDETLKMLEDDGRVGFRYCGPDGKIDKTNNLNGSRNNIAGIYNKRGTILGMMPHPENAVEKMLGGTGGKPMFDGIFTGLERLLA